MCASATTESEPAVSCTLAQWVAIVQGLTLPCNDANEVYAGTTTTKGPHLCASATNGRAALTHMLVWEVDEQLSHHTCWHNRTVKGQPPFPSQSISGCFQHLPNIHQPHIHFYSYVQKQFHFWRIIQQLHFHNPFHSASAHLAPEQFQKRSNPCNKQHQGSDGLGQVRADGGCWVMALVMN